MLNLAANFRLEGKPVSEKVIGSGHINRTSLITDDLGNRFIIQRINHLVFRNVPALMENIRLVTEYLRRMDSDPRHSLEIIPTLDGSTYFHDDSGYYRVYRYVEDTVSMERAETEEEFFQCAQAFGNFQNQLSCFDASLLSETIPRFHDTPNRVNNLKIAAEKDILGRLKEVRAEYEFAMERAEDAHVMPDLLKQGRLKLRVTHNDTKLGNVLFDAKTRKPICIVDLDTVMPGLAGNDFGDSIRSGAGTAEEDEPDTEKMTLSLPMFTAYTKGFLQTCGRNLTEDEIRTLPMGAKMMTYETGMRFLTDYLEGDVYYHIDRERQNVDRCRTQFKLIYEMEKNWKAMEEIVEREAGK